MTMNLFIEQTEFIQKKSVKKAIQFWRGAQVCEDFTCGIISYICCLIQVLKKVGFE